MILEIEKDAKARAHFCGKRELTSDGYIIIDEGEELLTVICYEPQELLYTKNFDYYNPDHILKHN